LADGAFPSSVSCRDTSQLQEFQNAIVEADSLRHEGKTVSASASFSGRIRLAESGDFPAELTFDSFENLKTEAPPEAHSMAHLSAQLLQPAGGEWGKREGCTGVDATRQLPVDA
jgi:hypothetical protein